MGNRLLLHHEECLLTTGPSYCGGEEPGTSSPVRAGQWSDDWAAHAPHELVRNNFTILIGNTKVAKEAKKRWTEPFAAFATFVFISAVELMT